MPEDNSPGSIIAIADGCTCPMAKNNFGAGLDLDSGWGYLVHSDCPVHHIGLKVALHDQLANTKNVNISSISLCRKKKTKILRKTAEMAIY